MEKNLKKPFDIPELEVVSFSIEDVITSSPPGGKDNWETEEF